MHRGRYISWAMVAFLVLPGCSGDGSGVSTAPVSGRITLEGQPLPWGVVIFTPTDRRPATGLIQPDGTYQLSTDKDGDGASIGEHGVSVIYTDQKPGAETNREAPPPKWLVPRRYGEPSLSGLQFTVQANTDNVANFDLKKK